MEAIITLVPALIGLLKKSDDGQKRTNIRVAKRTLKNLRKEFKKNDGKIDSKEQASLDELQEAINQANIDLLSGE